MSPAQAETQPAHQHDRPAVVISAKRHVAHLQHLPPCRRSGLSARGMAATAARRRGVNAGVFLISRSLLFWRTNIDLADISSRPMTFTS
jgi:hypothetical protein